MNVSSGDVKEVRLKEWDVVMMRFVKLGRFEVISMEEILYRFKVCRNAFCHVHFIDSFTLI